MKRPVFCERIYVRRIMKREIKDSGRPDIRLKILSTVFYAVACSFDFDRLLPAASNTGLSYRSSLENMGLSQWFIIGLLRGFPNLSLKSSFSRVVLFRAATLFNIVTRKTLC